jgi:hypothetical protein
MGWKGAFFFTGVKMSEYASSDSPFLNRYHPSTPANQLTSKIELEDGVNSFTGVDLSVYIFYPGLYTKEQLAKEVSSLNGSSIFRRLGTLRYFSWGFTRTKSVVTNIGRAVGKGFTRGVRIITGVMTFLQIDRTAFDPLYDTTLHKDSPNTNGSIDRSPYRYIDSPDSLPPFNLLLVYVNEKGAASYRVINHVEIVQGQGTDSIDEADPTESYSFVALSMSPLLPLTALRGRPSDLRPQGTIYIGDVVSKSGTRVSGGLFSTQTTSDTTSNTGFQDSATGIVLNTIPVSASSAGLEILPDTNNSGGSIFSIPVLNIDDTESSVV